MTIVVATHLDDVVTLSDQVGVLRDGRLVFHGALVAGLFVALLGPLLGGAVTVATMGVSLALQQYGHLGFPIPVLGGADEVGAGLLALALGAAAQTTGAGRSWLGSRVDAAVRV